MNLSSKKAESKCNTTCCVYSCKSVRRKNPDLTYHSFPKAGKENVAMQDDYGGVQIIDRRKAWETKLKMGKKVSQWMLVCSLHFTKDDYYYAAWQGSRRLLPTAVPSQNLPVRSHDLCKEAKKIKEIRSIARSQRRETRISKLSDAKIVAAEPLPVETIVPQVQHASISEDVSLEVAESLLLLSQSSPKKLEAPKEFRDIGIQVNLDLKEVRECAVQVNTSEMATVCDFIQTETQLNSLTGLHTFALLNTFVRLLSLIKKDKRIHRLSLYKRVVLCFMKMKLDLPYVILAVLFNVSSQTCKQIFFDLIPSMAKIVKIPFPSHEEIQRSMPKCFKDYQDVRIVMDCTEIFVQKRQRLCCRIKLYSHYKGTTTIKFLTGVSPAGLITYVSPPYGGRTSDKAIFERSNLLQKLRMNKDHIMVDKGFLIEDLCVSYGITLIRPPFLQDKKQFSREEALLNAKIAAARVHVERVNQRIKIFRILSNCLPINLVPLIHDIFLIACGITNWSAPILADDKFLS